LLQRQAPRPSKSAGCLEQILKKYLPHEFNEFQRLPSPFPITHVILKLERAPRSPVRPPRWKSAAQRFIVSGWASKSGRR
jgi:hypothetical protein